jgi:Big-like domain-containing protein
LSDNEYSRRAFLKKFALLSAGSLSLSAITLACYGPVYGPAPSNFIQPTVTAMYFTGSQSNLILLQGSQDVPVHTTFLIEFSKAMNASAPNTVYFSDSDNNTVPYTKAWKDSSAYSLAVTPSADLRQDAGYTIRMGADAADTDGNQINLDGNATAVFKTVAG